MPSFVFFRNILLPIKYKKGTVYRRAQPMSKKINFLFLESSNRSRISQFSIWRHIIGVILIGLFLGGLLWRS